jgi:hypothetical protein
MVLLCAVADGSNQAPAQVPKATSSASGSGIDVLALENLGKGLAPVDGAWQFHLGDDLSYGSPTLDDAEGHNGWERLTTDKSWGAQTHPAYVGYAWYRRHIHVQPVAGESADMAMLIRHVDDAYEVYWNGKLIGGFGKLPPGPVHYYRPPAQTLGLGPITDGVLAFRVWKAPLNSFDSDQLGGFYFPPVIGSPAAIGARKAELDYTWMRSEQFVFALTSLYALVMVLSLLFWLRDRSQRLLLSMAVYCFSLVAGIFLLSLRIPFPNDFALGWFQPIFILQDVGLWYVLLYILKLDQNPRIARATRILAIVAVIGGSLDGLLVPITSPEYVQMAQLADAILTAVTTIIEPFPLVLVAFGLRQRLDAPRWLVAIFASLAGMFSVVRIGVQQGSRFTHWKLADKIDAPLFNVLGNNITPQNLMRVLLLVAIVYGVYRYSREASLRQSTLEQEFKSARELQQILVPETLPDIAGFTLTSAYKPAAEVGGDFFQIISLAESSTLIVLGDVSGKGLKAAMTVSLLVGAIRMAAETSSSPSEILAALNRRLYGRMQGGFATCIALRLDPDGGCILATAGHPAPFLNQREIELPGALPLGLTPDAGFEETTLRLREGDHFALYTDGLLEARNATGELYGFERLNILFGTYPTALQATEEAVAFGQDDDITVLTLTRSGLTPLNPATA